MRRDSVDNLSLLSATTQWHHAGHAGAPGRTPGFDDKASPQTPCVRPHVCEAVAPLLVVVGKPHPVVRHRQPELIPSEVELDQHPARPGMAKGVDEGVVGYGEQAEAEGGKHPVVPDDKAQRNFTDTESRIIPAPGGKDFLQAYNCQAVVDSATR